MPGDLHDERYRAQLVERAFDELGTPGPVWTPLIPSTLPEEHVAAGGDRTPVRFPASNESRFVTGEVYGATGGCAQY